MNNNKSLIGFILGFFFGILGLLGLLACSDQAEKGSFMRGWLIAFIINIVLIVVLCVLVLGAAATVPYRYY